MGRSIFRPLRHNPLHNRSLDESDPALWSPQDIKALIIPGPASYRSPRGHVPVFPYHQPLKDYMRYLETMICEKYSERQIFSQLFDTIHYTMSMIGVDRQTPVINCGSDKIVVNGRYFGVPFNLGCSVTDNELPIFHLTNSLLCYEERRELIPDLAYIPQDEVSTDAFDVAALIAQAADQKRFSDGPDGIYKAHVMYPTATYRRLVLLTGWVPSATVTALKEGREMLEPIKLCREVIDIPTNPDCDWKKIDLFQVLAGLIDEAAMHSAI